MFERYASTEHGVLKIAAIIGTAILLFVGLTQLMCRTRADSDAIIRSSEALQKHDGFCTALPRPKDFRLAYRTVGGNSFTTAITYVYESHMSYADVRDFFLENLITQGWTKSGQYDEEMTPIPKEISFSKENYRVVLSHVSARGADLPGEYGLYCAFERK